MTGTEIVGGLAAALVSRGAHHHAASRIHMRYANHAAIGMRVRFS